MATETALLVADSLIGLDLPAAPQVIEPAVVFAASAEELRARLRRWERRFQNANAERTLKALRSDWQQFYGWCERAGVRPVPVSTHDLLRFLDDMATMGRRGATIKRYLYSIREVHKGAQAPDPTAHPDWALEWKGILRRLKDARRLVSRQTMPLFSDAVQQILKTLGSAPRDLRDAALLLLASDTLCRESELAQVALEHFERKRNGTGWTLKVEFMKNDPDGIGTHRYVSNTTKTAIDKWCAVAGINEGPIFLPIGGRPKQPAKADHRNKINVPPPPPQLRPDQIALILRRRAKRAGITTAKRITGHSARVGSCIELIEAGHSPTAVAFAGGWKGERMVLHYAKRALAGESAMAQYRDAQEKKSKTEE